MIETRIEPLRERLYGTYASQHPGCGDGEAAALIYRRDIRPALLRSAAGPVLDTFDRIANALFPGGVFLARVPNAASPFGGRIRYGDFTHESSHTVRSVRRARRRRALPWLPCGLVGPPRMAC